MKSRDGLSARNSQGGNLSIARRAEFTRTLSIFYLENVFGYGLIQEVEQEMQLPSDRLAHLTKQKRKGMNRTDVTIVQCSTG